MQPIHEALEPEWQIIAQDDAGCYAIERPTDPEQPDDDTSEAYMVIQRSNGNLTFQRAGPEATFQTGDGEEYINLHGRWTRYDWKENQPVPPIDLSPEFIEMAKRFFDVPPGEPPTLTPPPEPPRAPNHATIERVYPTHTVVVARCATPVDRGPATNQEVGANARRIVACVNALEGVSTEDLERIAAVTRSSKEHLRELSHTLWHNADSLPNSP